MADNFGLKIGIEGEKEFKKALSEINQSFKVLGSEMKLVSSQFDANDKSIQALSARKLTPSARRLKRCGLPSKTHPSPLGKTTAGRRTGRSSLTTRKPP